MKKIKLLSLLLAVLTLTASLPVLSLAAGAEGEIAVGELPETLPDKDTYRWAFYAAGGEKEASMHVYPDQSLGKVVSRTMPDELYGARFNVKPLVTVKDMKNASGGSQHKKGRKITKDVFAEVTSFENGGTVAPGAVGLMLRLTNLQTDDYGGMCLYITVGDKEYHCSPSGGGNKMEGCIYYYDYGYQTWVGEDFFATGFTQFRLRASYDGYLYVPVSSFRCDADNTILTSALLSASGVSKVRVVYRWSTGGMIFQSIDAVYEQYARFTGIAPVLSNELGWKVTAGVQMPCTTVAAEFSCGDGEPVTVNGTPDEDGTTYSFLYPGLLFQDTDETVSMRLLVDGAEKDTARYSLNDYAMAQAANGNAGLAADLLRLGIAADAYAGTAQEVSSEVSDLLKNGTAAPDPDDLPTVKAFGEGTDPSFAWVSCGASYGIWLGLRVFFDADDAEGLTVTAKAGDATYTYDKFYRAGDHYFFQFDHMDPNDLGAAVTFTCNREGAGSMTYSVADALRNDLAGKNESKKALAGAIWNFYRTANAAGLTLTLAAGGQTDYVIVYSDRITDAMFSRLNTFTSDFAALTGAKILSGTESRVTPGAKEIVICDVSGRDTEGAMSRTPYTGYRIEVSGERILVCAFGAEQLKAATEKLLGALTLRDGAWTLSAVYGIKVDIAENVGIPNMATAAGRSAGIYASGEGNYEVVLNGVTEEEYLAYVASLKEDGYTEYDSNVIADNRFVTLCKKGTSTLHVNWYPALTSCRIVACGEDQLLPATEKESFTPVQGLTPYVTQISYIGGETGNFTPGMSYVIQLSDGRFIIVDGGMVGDVPNNEVAQLYNYLVDNTPSGKPVIAMWMFTHSHGDHMDTACKFLRTYSSSQITLESLVYNFPNHLGCVNDLLTSTASRFPKAKHYVMHAGQKYYVADAEIEVLYTHEDFFPLENDGENWKSSVWRMTINGKTMLFVGDCEDENCSQIAACYGESLQSDILQVAHHGFSAKRGNCNMNQLVDPKIALWSCDKTRFLNDGRILGLAWGKTWDALLTDENGKVYATEEAIGNYWLRNNGWTRGDKTGERLCYHASSEVKILFYEILTVISSQAGK